MYAFTELLHSQWQMNYRDCTFTFLLFCKLHKILNNHYTKWNRKTGKTISTVSFTQVHIFEPFFLIVLSYVTFYLYLSNIKNYRYSFYETKCFNFSVLVLKLMKHHVHIKNRCIFCREPYSGELFLFKHPVAFLQNTNIYVSFARIYATTETWIRHYSLLTALKSHFLLILLFNHSSNYSRHCFLLVYE